MESDKPPKDAFEQAAKPDKDEEEAGAVGLDPDAQASMRLSGLLSAINDIAFEEPTKSPPTTIDFNEGSEQIRQQLVVLLHTQRCLRQEEMFPFAATQHLFCIVPHCRTMKVLLRHMDTCEAGPSCTVTHCVSSRQILNHWNTCTKQDCSVCAVVRETVPTSNTGHTPSTAQSPSNAEPSAEGAEPQPQDRAGNDEPVEFPPPMAMTALPLENTQDWHSSTTIDLRNHLVYKIVEQILPPRAVTSGRINDFISFTQKMEAELYGTAESRSQYFHMIAEKIYLIKAGIEAKKRQNAAQK